MERNTLLVTPTIILCLNTDEYRKAGIGFLVRKYEEWLGAMGK